MKMLNKSTQSYSNSQDYIKKIKKIYLVWSLLHCLWSHWSIAINLGHEDLWKYEYSLKQIYYLGKYLKIRQSSQQCEDRGSVTIN